jgi:muramoyltetrapeptide carboxypeptidase
VAVVSPSSWPDSRGDIDPLLHTLETWGLRPQVGAHLVDRRGYMAGTDADRLADLNQALRDPGIRAVIASRGGCGGLRLVHGVDRQALEHDPKPLVGYSDITALHQVWRRAGVPRCTVRSTACIRKQSADTSCRQRPPPWRVTHARSRPP